MTRRAAALLLLCACPADDAPGAGSGAVSEESGTGSGGEPFIDCADMPLGAVGAEYSYQPRLSGATAASWTVLGLPEGLLFDAASGEISGVPVAAQAGVPVSVQAVTTDGDLAADCVLSVNAALSIDFEALWDSPPYCLRPPETVVDLIESGTGDDTPITCRFSGAIGDGTMPEGISVDDETCAVEGENTDTRHGTWVFIVEAVQSGATLHVPYCVIQDEPTGYDVAPALEPWFRRFDPEEPVTFEGPRVDVSGGDCSDQACFFGYQFAIGDSPFDPSTIAVDPQGLLEPATGFFHGFTIRTTGDLADVYRARPWAALLTFDYCLADSVGAPGNPADGRCESPDMVRANSEGFAAFSILMAPL